MVLLVDQEVLRGSFMYSDLHLYCVHTEKSNKVLLFGDLETPVGFDPFCVWKTSLVIVVPYVEKILCPGVVARSLLRSFPARGVGGGVGF